MSSMKLTMQNQSFFKPGLVYPLILNNERTCIRTIVKWSKPALILIAVAVLLIAVVFVGKAHAESIEQVESHKIQLTQSQEEISKTKTQLEESQLKAENLQTEVQARDERIQQLESENQELKG